MIYWLVTLEMKCIASVQPYNSAPIRSKERDHETEPARNRRVCPVQREYRGHRTSLGRRKDGTASYEADGRTRLPHLGTEAYQYLQPDCFQDRKKGMLLLRAKDSCTTRILRGLCLLPFRDIRSRDAGGRKSGRLEKQDGEEVR